MSSVWLPQSTPKMAGRAMTHALWCHMQGGVFMALFSNHLDVKFPCSYYDSYHTPHITVIAPFGSSPLVYYFKAGDSLPVFVFQELPSPAAALHLNLPATICPSENQLNLILVFWWNYSLCIWSLDLKVQQGDIFLNDVTAFHSQCLAQQPLPQGFCKSHNVVIFTTRWKKEKKSGKIFIKTLLRKRFLFRLRSLCEALTLTSPVKIPAGRRAGEKTRGRARRTDVERLEGRQRKGANGRKWRKPEYDIKKLMQLQELKPGYGWAAMGFYSGPVPKRFFGFDFGSCSAPISVQLSAQQRQSPRQSVWLLFWCLTICLSIQRE